MRELKRLKYQNLHIAIQLGLIGWIQVKEEFPAAAWKDTQTSQPIFGCFLEV